MNNLKVFKNSEFGELGILLVDGKEYFPATECASLLGYKTPRDAIIKHCKGVVKCDSSLDKRIKYKNYIPESDLYRLIVKSKLPSAERFEKWVFEEILPAIRKHGGYLTPEKIEEVLLNPDTIIKLATNLKNEQQRRKELEIEVEDLQKTKAQISRRREAILLVSFHYLLIYLFFWPFVML